MGTKEPNPDLDKTLALRETPQAKKDTECHYQTQTVLLGGARILYSSEDRAPQSTLDLSVRDSRYEWFP